MKTRQLCLISLVVMVAGAGCAANMPTQDTPTLSQRLELERQESIEKFKKLRAEADQGDAAAQYNLGLAYDTGEGVEQDSREAVRWYRKAADQGDAAAQYNLGLAYDTGEGVERDSREAVRWYRKAADQGDAAAQYNLGLAYDTGEGVERDSREAMRWYRKAAEQGHAWAEAKLRDEQNRVAEEQRAEQEKNELAAWRIAAEQGEAWAYYNVGWAYSNGKNGVEQDSREAVRWYRKAAEQGYAEAQQNLGNAYYNGEGVERDYREAVRWFRKAAEQGHAGAQVNLGVLYAKGEGIDQNYREAVRWARAAAEQGDPQGQSMLGIAYYNGTGVIKNEAEAYIWWSIAKANGDKIAADILGKIDWLEFFVFKRRIRNARKEAAQRMEAIENREKKPASKPALSENIAIAPIPQRTNIATHVFEQTWRSVVVVLNGDSQGSGVIIRPNIVATNCHVVNEGSDITVYKAHNRRANTDTAYPATIRHADANRDFCLLDVVGLWGVPVTVRRYDTLNVGEDVYALGAPKGLDLSLSDGLVSQLRTRDGNRVIQTNAEISFGSSGGGLFDSEGNLVGIVTAKLIDKDIEGIAFAIPADLTLEH